MRAYMYTKSNAPDLQSIPRFVSSSSRTYASPSFQMTRAAMAAAPSSPMAASPFAPAFGFAVDVANAAETREPMVLVAAATSLDGGSKTQAPQTWPMANAVSVFSC